ncbi:MAG: ATP-binding protein [Nautiliaceae bacterium]
MKDDLVNNCQKEKEEIEKLKKQVELLKAKIEQDKKLFSTFSHDIRNFVNSILGFLELLTLQETDPTKFEYIKSAQNSVYLILNLVNDVLELSKMEEGKLKINEYFYIPINEYKSIYNVFYPSAIEKNIFFIGFFDPLLPYAIKGDEYRIKQIISNLFSNAIKFTPEGGMIKFKINYKTKTNSVEITVSDSGIGMTQEELDRLFKPFEQANDLVAARFGGTGLGMSIVFNLVKMMGGSVKVRSKKGKGTTFKISFPCKTYETIPPSVDKSEFEKFNIVILHERDKILNSEIVKLIMRYFRRIGIHFKVVDRKELFELIKSNEDYLFIIPDLEDEYCSEDFCEPHLIESNKKILFIKRTRYKAKNLPYNVKVLPIPFIGGNLFKEIKGMFEKQSSIEEKKESTKILSVLVIDDNPINLKIMKELLKSMNMVPFLAQDEIEGMEILNNKKIDVAFIDENMPTISGTELIQEIRRYPKFNKVRIFGLTGDASDEVRKKLIKAGAEDVLVKPISREKLEKLFRQYF